MKSLEAILTTSDGLKIAGIYIPGSLPIGVILLHMMPATKEAYASLSEDLSKSGFHTLAIDFRGHGSSEGGNYKDFENEDHQKYILDLHAAIDFLKKQNPDIKIGIVGASIGANIGMQYASENDLVFLALLSPGLNYRGVAASEYTKQLSEKLPVYFAAALDDSRVEGNAIQTETLYNACTSKAKSINILQSGGHANELLENKDFEKSLIDWIKQVAGV